VSNEKLLSSEKAALTKSHKAIVAAFDEKIVELEPKRDELQTDLTKTAITVHLCAVPPVIEKGTRRKAKQTIGIEEKGVPKDLEEEFLLAQSAHLISFMVTSIVDLATGEANDGADYDDAIALMGYLPPSQYARLDQKMGEIQYTDAISRQIENQEDFS
jgi:hypothetical protein